MLDGEGDGPDPVIGVPVKPESKPVFIGSWLPSGYCKLSAFSCWLLDYWTAAFFNNYVCEYDIFMINALRTLPIQADLVFTIFVKCIIQFAENKCI
jgi:hypothetical protein